MSPTKISRDTAYKTISFTRSFAAPRSKVWQAWTTRELLEKWSAPKPWVTVTKTFDFSEGGQWLYYMESPEGEKVWSLTSFDTIDPENSYTALDAFCDEAGNESSEIGTMHWKHEFIDNGEVTEVYSTITFGSDEDMNAVIGMGFEDGFQMGLDNLEELLKNS